MARVQEIRGMAEWYATDIATGNRMCIPGIVE